MGELERGPASRLPGKEGRRNRGKGKECLALFFAMSQSESVEAERPEARGGTARDEIPWGVVELSCDG
jgi:hypothetical protein